MFFASIKFAIFACGYIGLYLLEKYCPYFLGRDKHLTHSLKNLSLATINMIVGGAFLIFLFYQLLAWCKENQFGLLNNLQLNDLSSLLLAIILIDLWQYWWHRLNHTIPFLWRLHRVHHADKELDASSSLRFHPFEIILSSSARIAIIPLIGIQLEQLLTYEAIVLAIILFHHSNIKLDYRIDRWLRTIIVTPNMHRLHHSDQQQETDSNYSSVFSIWDRLFRSYSTRSIEHNFNLGLGDKFSEQQWNSVIGMLKIPLQKDTNLK